MNIKIKKRDGRLVKFNAEKITNAIAKAGAATWAGFPAASLFWAWQKRLDTKNAKMKSLPSFIVRLRSCWTQVGIPLRPA